MTGNTICSAFGVTAAARPDAVALRDHGSGVEVSWREYARRVRAIAGGLHALGVGPGDTVALMLGNRPEFHLVDTAALHVGAAPFSIYNTLASEQIAHVLANSGTRVVVCEQQYVERLREADREQQVEHVVVVDGGQFTLDDLEGRGAADFDLDAAADAVGPDDLATIIYTSGTTGPSKGVEITHANLLAEFAAVDSYLSLDQSDCIVSYLPDAHIANRAACHYNNLIRGIAVTTLADPKQLVSALPQVRPTVFLAVPAIWYKVKAGLEAALVAEPSRLKRTLAQWAIRTGVTVARRRSDGVSIPPALQAQHLVAERLVLGKLRVRMGLDRVRLALTGASPIAPDAMAFMLGLGVPVSEVWGMSETTGAVTLNPPGAVRIGTVGTVGTVVPGGTELSLADDGELLVRGPLIMRGYRANAEQTAETVDADGWLHTGDIATIDDEGYVRIVDRKKELIINASGKNMSPTAIENMLTVSCPLIGSAVAIGDDRRYVTALITLDADASANFARNRSIPVDEVGQHPDLRAELDRGVAAANERLARVEQVKKYVLLPGQWEPGGDELTPTMKLKRKPIERKYAAQIASLYE